MAKTTETIKKLKFLPAPPKSKAFRNQPRPNTKRQLFVGALKSRPGQWAQYPFPVRYAQTLASQFRKQHGLEAVVREGAVFARVPGGQ